MGGFELPTAFRTGILVTLPLSSVLVIWGLDIDFLAMTVLANRADEGGV